MFLSDSSSSIKVEILNATGGTSVVTGQANTVMLRLTNATGAAVPVQASAPADPVTGTAFAVLAFFDAFYAAGQGSPADLQVAAPGWSAAYFPNAEFPAWAIASDTDFAWADGAPVTFTVKNFVPTVKPTTYYLTFNVDNVNGGSEAVQIPVAVQNPPSGRDLSKTVSLTVKNASITITKTPSDAQPNTLVLRLANTDPNNSLVPPGTQWPGTPSFTLSFVYGQQPGAYALATSTGAADWGAGVSAPAQWDVVKNDGPTWSFNPIQQTNDVILGTGNNAWVEFTVSSIVTTFLPGPTLLYLQYTSIPGFTDGSLAIPLDKEYALMSIGEFVINTNQFTVDGDAPATGYLNWKVANADLVELEGYGAVNARAVSYPVTIDRTQRFVLTAYDIHLGKVISASQPVTVLPGLATRLMPVDSIVMWSGDVSAIPPGWLLCDGSNGTPDMRERFLVGAGSTNQPNESGTSTHVHNLGGWAAQSFATTTDGDHAHLMPSAWYARSLSCGKWSGVDVNAQPPSNWYTQNSGGHNHSVGVGFSGVQTSTQNGGLRPAWYALCFIMKQPA
ncbi:MAG: hypothetical protein QOJ39_2413 [Candidatus Eremiobacteraeota bacterium]|jgi:hypothetical protein|nr:hypothetical protein [Candidatus Eremiobacteraeota bacterium]